MASQEKNQHSVAVVTGAGTGIGRAVSLSLLKAGYSVALAGRRSEPLVAVVAEALEDFHAFPKRQKRAVVERCHLRVYFLEPRGIGQL